MGEDPDRVASPLGLLSLDIANLAFDLAPEWLGNLDPVVVSWLCPALYTAHQLPLFPRFNFFRQKLASWMSLR